MGYEPETLMLHITIKAIFVQNKLITCSPLAESYKGYNNLYFLVSIMGLCKGLLAIFT